MVLGEDDPWWPAYAALALTVAASRIHVRIHHASDVLAGVATGLALGALARRLAPLARGPGSAGSAYARLPRSRS